MCIDEKKLHSVLFGYSVIREVNQAWFESLNFQFDEGGIPPSVCLWYAKR